MNEIFQINILGKLEKSNLFFDNENALIYLASSKKDSDIRLNKIILENDLKIKTTNSFKVNYNNYFFQTSNLLKFIKIIKADCFFIG